ncbi:caspase family protein [Pleurocapsa sp. PCC 7319]|uniref:caspase family protein n=1 Tax=Pleurocapsa sp. PCC 7319 TaxID=118161 RepID=UPI00034C4015|nr:caspase family protein [Pleurocapsa sp. PCC 7319]
MGLDRRTFLQQAGLALFALGTTEAGLLFLENNSQLAPLVKNYRQILAQPTNRKLALLVGINRYPHQEHLEGCLTDLELQRELLIHRFGFNPRDIVVLSDRQATRENIETLFIEHLAEQARPDDVVVFHFSGYGGQIKMPLSIEREKTPNLTSPDTFQLVNSLVPADSVLSSSKSSIANNVLQETLLVLAQSLSTTKCTFVLDTSFNTTPRVRHGNFKIRSTTEIADAPSSQELLFLEQLRNKLALKGLKPSKRLLSLPGVVLSAASKNQVAAERQWDGFSAGLFTLALTQHLWQITPSSRVQVALSRTAATVEQIMGRQQQPTLNSHDKSTISYYLATGDVPTATGVISKVNGNSNFEVKLLGLPAKILDCYGVNSCLSLILPNKSHNLPQLRIKSMEGLIGKTKLLEPERFEVPQVGQFIRETIRMLERNLSLTLALDANLQRIERVDATSALANIPAVNSAVISGEQNADCLLGKVDHVTSLKVTVNNPVTSENQFFSYGLYTPGGVLIGKTTGAEEEAVKIAIDRLQPQFNNLLAAKWLELTINDFSSELKVDATLTAKLNNQVTTSLQKATFLSEIKQPSPKKLAFPDKNQSSDTINTVPIFVKGSEINLSISNTGDRQLYAIVLGIDADSNIFALYTPSETKTAESKDQPQNIVVPPQTELVIPQVENSWKWKVPDSVGINTLYVVFAVKPWQQTLPALATQQNYKSGQPQILNVVNPHLVLEMVMQDLHSISSVDSELLPKDDVYALDVHSWATLNFVYEVANA